MTGKADFTDAEWEQIIEAPTSAGLLVVMAERGGTFRETFSMAKAYNDARQQHGASELLDAVVSTRPKVDRHAGGSPEELKERSLAHVRDAVATIEHKATPEELEDYRRFVLTLAEDVAEAHREHGVAVSDRERATIAEIAQALGAAP
jgi:hypothetical protein